MTAGFYSAIKQWRTAVKETEQAGDFMQALSRTIDKHVAIKDLIERLEKAAAPDRELDEAIRVACGYPPKPWNYTASIDAALMLVPEGWNWSYNSGTFDAYVTNYFMRDWPEYHGANKNPAIALCIAALKARMAAERDLTQEARHG